MDRYTCFPDQHIGDQGPVSAEFRHRGLATFHAACRHVHQMPYGYNSDREDLFILFKEGMGSCTTKHAVIATLAEELGLPVVKTIGIYAMTEQIVTGAQTILDDNKLPYLPMVHCFLASGEYRVDLTEGNRNGKNQPIDHFLYTSAVIPNVSAKAEYRLYRRALTDRLLIEGALQGFALKTVLQAREAGLRLLRRRIAA
ncbi:MAG: hypothetical protein QNJ22_16275 [Desulfosarcinaceae bacterium]|nr:hypothetical protein [Desulfosarcinaceae bacterium]